MPETDVITKSTITCPVCGTAKIEAMLTDACQYFYECTGCHMQLTCYGSSVPFAMSQ
jgi:hypothetical protein